MQMEPKGTVREVIHTGLRKLRLAKNWTQEELEKASSVPRVTISRYENGERKMMAESANKLSKALGCTIDELLDPINEDANYVKTERT